MCASRSEALAHAFEAYRSRVSFRRALVSGAEGNMKIEQIDLREIHLRLRAPFETSFGSVQDRRILLVQVRSDGLSGWGESTAMEGPFFNSETIDTAWMILRDHLIPAIVGKEISGGAD